MSTFHPYAYHLWSRWLLGTLSISSLMWASLVTKTIFKNAASSPFMAIFVCVCACAHMHAHAHICMCSLSCLTLYDSMDCSPPGSSVYGIFQAGILEWIAIPFSRGSSRPRDRIPVSCIAGKFLIIWAIREATLPRRLQLWPIFWLGHLFFWSWTRVAYISCITGFYSTVGVSGKEFTLIPESGRSPGEGNGNPLQCSGLENSTDRGAWRATVHGVTQSWIQLSNFLFHFTFKNRLVSI